MAHPTIAVLAWLPDGVFEQLQRDHTDFDWRDARTPDALNKHLAEATITYGLPPVDRLAEAPGLRWVQLISAGVPPELCVAAGQRGITVTNLAGLYGPSIAEHALGLLVLLTKNFHAAMRNQLREVWDRDVGNRIGDLRGQTLAVVGLGNIGRNVARLARAFGMQVIGCRRRAEHPVPEADRVYPVEQIRDMLAKADHVVVAAPLIASTEGMLGPREFAAMKPGAIYVNVSRGPVAQEEALVEALRSGRLAAAGLDVFATEPLPPGHPFWQMPQVVVIPHVAGEAINQSARPAERFRRNLVAWQMTRPLEGLVDLEWGY
jgi:phosphoglycerate dehydrogenase-like enzyme